jgi:beta-lactamase regulating signal transducer with metallopeptidase domain
MLAWSLENTLIAGGLALLVLGICRLTLCRPAARHALWLIVLVKMLLPPVGPTMLAMPRLWATWFPRPVAQAILPAGERPLHVIDFTEEEAMRRYAGNPSPLRFSKTKQLPAMRRPWPSFAEIAMELWLAGSLALAAAQLIRLGRFHCRVMAATTADDRLVDQIAHWANEMQIRPPRVRVLKGLASPMILATNGGELLWPQGLENEFDDRARTTVIVHELAHLRRKDHYVTWLEFIARLLWWWNPLVYFVCSQLRIAAEEACDAWVTHLLPDDRRAYAHALITVSTMATSPNEPLFALGMAHRARYTFERRLTMILREKTPARLSYLAGLAAVFALIGLPMQFGPTRAPAEEPVKQNQGTLAAPPTTVPKSATHKAELPPVASEIRSPQGIVHVESASTAGNLAMSEYGEGAEAEAMVRVTYRLKSERLEVVHQFLSCIAELDAKVDLGDLRDNPKEGKLFVTAKPETQRVIAQLIKIVKAQKTFPLASDSYLDRDESASRRRVSDTREEDAPTRRSTFGDR